MSCLGIPRFERNTSPISKCKFNFCQLIGTWRYGLIHPQQDLDVAKGERPDFRDFQGRCEAGSGVDKNRFRIKDGAAALVVRIGVIGGEVVLPVKAAHRDEVFAPVNHVQVK